MEKYDPTIIEFSGSLRLRVPIHGVDNVTVAHLGCSETWVVIRASYISKKERSIQLTIEVPYDEFCHITDLLELSKLDRFSKPTDGGEADNPPKK